MRVVYLQIEALNGHKIISKKKSKSSRGQQVRLLVNKTWTESLKTLIFTLISLHCMAIHDFTIMNLKQEFESVK